MKQVRSHVQGYNAQAVVTADQIVVAAELTQEANDRRQLQPMLARAQQDLVAAGMRGLGTLLADAGYWSDREVGPLLGDRDAPRLLVAAEMHPKHHASKSASARLRARMRRRLSSARGRALYAQRPQTCEPVFGEIKWTRGARRFMRRGLGACSAEWKLLCATNNLRKLWRAQTSGAPTS